MQDKHVIPTEPDVASPRRTDRQQDVGEWNREIASALAAKEGLLLTDEHWQVINFLRAYYVEQCKPTSARIVADALSARFAEFLVSYLTG